MSNPTKLSWRQDKLNTDGSVFDAAQFAGFELEINAAPAVSVPIAWDDDTNYEMPLADLTAVQATGDYTLRIRTVNKAGSASAYSAPATFAMDFRVPTAPTALSVS